MFALFFDVSAGFDSFPRVGVVCFGRAGLVVVKSLRRGTLVWGSFSVVVIRGAPVLTMTVVVRRGASVFRAVAAWLDVVVPGLGVRARGGGSGRPATGKRLFRHGGGSRGGSL